MPFCFIPLFVVISLQFNLKRGGQRVATMLMYLTDGVEGGETLFPGVKLVCPNAFLFLTSYYFILGGLI